VVQWFIQTYLPKQTIPVLRSFGDTIQTATGTWLGIKSQEKKVYLVEKFVSPFSPWSFPHLPLSPLIATSPSLADVMAESSTDSERCGIRTT